MIQKLKAKANSKKGFTLAELLIVVAILAVLVAIAVPVFTGALNKAEATVQDANFRAAKSQAMVMYLASSPAKTGDQLYSYTVDDKGNITLTETSSGTEGSTDIKTGIVKITPKDVNIGGNTTPQTK